MLRRQLSIAPRDDLVRLGSDYGGWWVPESLLAQSSVVYSVGIGGDASFDLEVIDRYSCEVWGFDPTPVATRWVADQSWPPQWHFDPTGLWTSSDVLTFVPPVGHPDGSASITRAGDTRHQYECPVEPLSALMARHGHSSLTLLKMDIEGAEGPVLDQILDQGITPQVLCVEYDQPESPWRLASRVRRVIEHGYELNHIENWNFTFTRG